jgi:hypothetical protein
MFARQVPASAILVDGQSMAGRQMPSDHQAAPAAFQADDIIPMNRSPDWHRGSSLCVEFGYRFTETCEGLMNGRDQSSELIGRDLIAPNVCGDNFSRKFSIDGGGWRFVGHFGSSSSDRQNTTPGSKERRTFRISIKVLRRSDHLLLVPAPG